MSFAINDKNKKISGYINKGIINPSTDLVLIALSSLKQLYSLNSDGYLFKSFFDNTQKALSKLCYIKHHYLESCYTNNIIISEEDLLTINNSNNIHKKQRMLKFFSLRDGHQLKNYEIDLNQKIEIFRQNLGILNENSPYIFDGIIFNPFPDPTNFLTSETVLDNNYYLYKKDQYSDGKKIPYLK
ncbi:hypothetical protein GKC56_01655 [Neisseriaceae bacterium PsAf]|nr:hypothetical protein [Neisseriaceae bacterium PsAf]